jgi:hypothetical protein
MQFRRAAAWPSSSLSRQAWDGVNGFFEPL